MLARYEIDEVTYIVPDMDCDHCEDVVSNQLLTIADVEAVAVDLETRCVTVYGQGLDVATLRASIGDVGFQAA